MCSSGHGLSYIRSGFCSLKRPARNCYIMSYLKPQSKPHWPTELYQYRYHDDKWASGVDGSIAARFSRFVNSSTTNLPWDYPSNSGKVRAIDDHLSLKINQLLTNFDCLGKFFVREDGRSLAEKGSVGMKGKS